MSVIMGAPSPRYIEVSDSKAGDNRQGRTEVGDAGATCENSAAPGYGLRQLCSGLPLLKNGSP
jgi:hypothetical protein